MFKVTQGLGRFCNLGSVQSLLRFNNFASAPITATVRNAENDTSESVESNKRSQNVSEKVINLPKHYNSLVAAAFASLKTNGPPPDSKTPFTDNRITKATTVNELLSISEGSGISRRHALKVVSVLADWTTSGRVDLSEFESDPRFIRLCKILTKGNNTGNKNFISLKSEDLSTIINVTADDEAAKLISSISLPQMVKVMSTLSQKKRRSTPLLRSLAFNISRSSDHLDIKQSADVLYSAANLNFMDENLLEKVCSDVCLRLQENIKGSAVIGSILTSLGILRYKETRILDDLSKYILENHSTCRVLDVFSLFITLGTLNHQSSNAERIYETLIPQLTSADANKPSLWLDYVWSLIVLQQAKPEHVESVLNKDFINKFEVDTGYNTSNKLKILNIDSASHLLLDNYKGSRLPSTSDIKNLIISRSKDKEVMVCAVQDALGSLFNATTHLKCNVDTGLGFYIDAELAVDMKGNALPLEAQTDDRIKVAVLVYDYHDMSRGRIEPTGFNCLYSQLLDAQGYQIVTVPFTEFNLRDKLINRVKYLETKLKELRHKSNLHN